MKKWNISLASIASAALCLGTVAQAQTSFPIEPRPFHFEYTYAEISYVDMDDGLNGLAAYGSYRLQDNLNILAGMISTASNKNDYDVLRLSLAYNAAWPDAGYNVDYMSYAGLESRRRQHQRSNGARVSEQDISLRVGTRLQLALQPRLIVYTDLAFTLLDSGKLALNNGLIYHLTGRLSLQASYELSDQHQFNLGIRVTQR